MKKNPFSYASRIDLTIIAVAIILVVAVIAFLCFKTRNDSLSLSVNDDIEDTPTLLNEIREIGQWEFLTVSDEEMIDTVRKGFFSDDELVRIYYGTVRIGIDFSLADENWIIKDGDSIRLDLPPVQILDENFLDETRTKSFIEKGTWTNSDRKELADRARIAIRQRCLTKENLDLAQRTAQQQITLFLNRIRKSRNI